MTEETGAEGASGPTGVSGVSGTPGGDLESSDSLRTFGAAVQGLREHAGLSRAEFGERVRFSKHTVASIEQGRRVPDPDFVEAAEAATGNTGALRRAVRHIARRQGLASWFRLWARMEAEAICLYTYECRLIPGLLQTAAYARASFRSQIPALNDDQIEAQLAARLERQRLLRERHDTSFGFIVEEHVLLRRIGGNAVTLELIEHLIDVAQLHIRDSKNTQGPSLALSPTAWQSFVPYATATDR